MTGSERTGIVDALLGDLDDDTRRRFGLRVMPAPGGAPVVPPMAPRRRSVWSLRSGDLVAIARATAQEVGADRVTSVAGGITFFGLLSLFPAITAFVSIYGLVADPAAIARHLDILRQFLPEGALEIIRGQVDSILSAPGSALSLAGIGGLLVAFYSANGGMKALLSALNVAYFQTETRGFLRLNLVAMAFTLSGLLLLSLMLGAVAVIPIALRWLPLDSLDSVVHLLVLWLRWPAMLLMLMLALAAVYRWGPAAPDSRWRWVSPGAVVAAVALVVVSMLFSWYAANFADYNKTYGSLGAAVGLMMWLWLTATIVLVGAELNSAIERHLRGLEGTGAEARTTEKDGSA